VGPNVFIPASPETYVPLIILALKRLNSDRNTLQVMSCKVPRQKPHPLKGEVDCGLFALAYTYAVCFELGPISWIDRNQSSMRHLYNKSLKEGSIIPFTFKLNECGPV
jgi:hypothetical protein